MQADRKLICRLEELAERLDPRDRHVVQAAALRLRQMRRGKLAAPKLTAPPPITTTTPKASIQPQREVPHGR